MKPMTVTPLTLTGRHVRLEPVSPQHIDGLFAIGQEPEDWRYMPRPCLQSRQDAAQWVDEALALQRRGQHFTFVICDAQTSAVLGSTRYLSVRPRDRSLEIGYTWLGKPAQRTAVNTETKLLLLSHAFEQLLAHRVELKTDARNLRSQKAIARLGATKEGVFRKHMVVQDGFVRDSVYFSIIANEWPGIKAGLEAKL